MTPLFHLSLVRWLRVGLFAAIAGLAPAAPGEDTPPKLAPGKASLYTIAITDNLQVSVFGEQDLSRTTRVDARGSINLPLVGEVKVLGLTLREAEQAISSSYRDHRILRNPQVTVTVESYAIREITVQGQVKSPQRVVMYAESTMTVLEAITKCGGFTDSAKGTEVRVTRVDGEGKVKVFVVDVDSLIKGKGHASSSDNSLLLQPGDIIYVPERII